MKLSANSSPDWLQTYESLRRPSAGNGQLEADGLLQAKFDDDIEEFDEVLDGWYAFSNGTQVMDCSWLSISEAFPMVLYPCLRPE